MLLEQSTCYLLLGSNMGDREIIINRAIELIQSRIGFVFISSSLYETAAWGKTDQAPFVNQAIGVKTTLKPILVLEQALQIEQELGRVRIEKWGERLIDIDILLYEQQVVDIKDRLQIPHPLMQDRKFVLEPLAEIAANYIHPVLNQSISNLSKNIIDPLVVKKM